MGRRRLVFALALGVVLGCLVACGDDGAAPEVDAAIDGRSNDGATEAAPPPDGSTGVFCREDTDCTPAEGAAPCALTFCDRVFLRCTTTGPDLDADGHADETCDPGVGASAVRGDDCDDTDPARFPGRPEICDPTGHDEDCNSTLVSGADGDLDGDSSFALTCCNRDDATGELLCGADCNDSDAAVNPSAMDGPDVACDGIDNDCDLEADEGCACRDGQSRRCGTDVGECLPGTETCVAGAWGECRGGVGPTPEDCDGDDDDCNMVDDDGCACVDGTSRPCGMDEGACVAGVQRCEGGVWSSLCEGAVGPAPETCDGDDDDCNGTLDDGCACLDGSTQPCPGGTEVGECVVGMQTCVAGEWAPCFGGVGPVTEVCDGVLDDNCNGRTDVEDGCECTLGMSASCGGGPVNVPPARCVLGARMCVDGRFGACEGSIEPVPETCNALDDDCDGLLNEEPEASASCAAMSATASCVMGSCVISGCATGRGNCDGDPGNGCETDTTSSLLHCGTCGNACGAGLPCMAGICNPVTGTDAGTSHTCVVRASGRVQCWGRNSEGQVGDGTTTSPRSLPMTVTEVVDAVEVSAGDYHTCARRSTGGVVCWGENAGGQLGDGTLTTPRASPVPVSGLTGVVEISAGGSHTCARQSGGTVMCWGSNNAGQLGDSTTMRRTTPVAVMGLTDAVEISAGGVHTCARRATGAIVCWGRNTDGQLGDGTTMQRPTPVPVLNVLDGVEVTTGTAHSCARRFTGEAVCWGRNTSGQLGYGVTTTPEPRAFAVSGPTDHVRISAGDAHTCSLRSTGIVVCWGDNAAGQIGDGTTMSPRTAPTPAGTFSDAVEMMTGGTHSCARRVTGVLLCWGSNGSGQIGDGTTMSPRPSPTLVLGIP